MKLKTWICGELSNHLLKSVRVLIKQKDAVMAVHKLKSEVKSCLVPKLHSGDSDTVHCCLYRLDVPAQFTNCINFVVIGGREFSSNCKKFVLQMTIFSKFWMISGVGMLLLRITERIINQSFQFSHS